MGYWLETLKYLRTERIQENYSMNDKRNAKVIKNDKNDKRYLKWNKKINSFARIELLCLFSLAFKFTNKSISKIKQSSLLWHFLIFWNCL